MHILFYALCWWFVVNAVLTVVIFAFWYYERRTNLVAARIKGGLEQLSVVRVMLGIVQEIFAFMWMQLTMIPAFIRDKKATPLLEDNKTPVLLVHGYACNSSSMWWHERQLKKAGYQARAVSYRPPIANVHKLIPQVKEHIRQMLKETGAKKIHYVCHSMGGVIARAILMDEEFAHRIDKVVCLGSPHHGTHAASLISLFVRGAIPQMTYECEYIRSLPQEFDCVSFYGICSQMDNLVLPVTSAVLPSAKSYAVDYLGHCALLYSPTVSRLVLDCLNDK